MPCIGAAHTHCKMRCLLPFIPCKALVGKSAAFLHQNNQRCFRNGHWEAQELSAYSSTIQRKLCSSWTLGAPPLYQKHRTEERACAGTLAMLVLGEKRNVLLHATHRDLPLLLMDVQ